MFRVNVLKPALRSIPDVVAVRSIEARRIEEVFVKPARDVDVPNVLPKTHRPFSFSVTHGRKDALGAGGFIEPQLSLKPYIHALNARRKNGLDANPNRAVVAVAVTAHRIY